MNQLALQIYQFLKTNKTIDRINFAFKGEERTYNVYPSAYRVDVADYIKDEKIEVERGKIDNLETNAEYKYGGWSHDTLVFSNGFDISNHIDQGYVIHECTHAYIDIQNIGVHSKFEDEATAWLAEAVYLCALGKAKKDIPLRVKCSEAAQKILSGQYTVEKDYSVPIIREVAKVYNHTTTKIYSNGVWRLRVSCGC